MRTHKKVNRKYDARQKDYHATISKGGKRERSYHKPGSKNPRKHGA